MEGDISGLSIWHGPLVISFTFNSVHFLHFCELFIFCELHCTQNTRCNLQNCMYCNGSSDVANSQPLIRKKIKDKKLTVIVMDRIGCVRHKRNTRL